MTSERVRGRSTYVADDTNDVAECGRLATGVGKWGKMRGSSSGQLNGEFAHSLRSEPRILRSVRDLRKRRGSGRMPVAVSFSGGNMELPDDRDPIPREH